MTNSLKQALLAVVNGYDYNPGCSDLDDEQPIHVRMTLGDYRRIAAEADIYSPQAKLWDQCALCRCLVESDDAYRVDGVVFCSCACAQDALD